MAVDSQQKDYYSILGVSKDADQQEIRKAFRKLARTHHPDVNPGNKAAEEKFKEINEANEVLSDPEKRKKYDDMRAYYQQYGRWPGEAAAGAGRGRQATGGFGGGGYQYYTTSEEDLGDIFGGGSPFSDFFETYFGGGGPGRGFGVGGTARTRRAQAARGEDVESEIDVTLSDAYQGATHTFELSQPDGTTRRLEVKIPAGVDQGSRIRIAGQGMPGSAGRGDLYLRVRMVPDDRFTRDGSNLRTTIDIPLPTAVLGGEAFVPTPDGRRLSLHIPPGTSSARTFRLRGQGMPLRVGQTDRRGDLLAEARVSVPTHLTDEQRRLFENFARSIGYTGSQTATGTGESHA